MSPSFNRVIVQKLPCGQFPTELRGLSGYDLLSSASLQDMVKARTRDLKIKLGTTNLLKTFDNCFCSAEFSDRETAQEIANAFGRRLALLLLTLKCAAPENRLARPSWRDEH